VRNGGVPTRNAVRPASLRFSARSHSPSIGDARFRSRTPVAAFAHSFAHGAASGVLALRHNSKSLTGHADRACV
jgi:hypothetical protein